MALTLHTGPPLPATTYNANVSGTEGGSVADLAALLARDTSTIADGLKVWVRDQGLFVFDASSTEESDGVSCFVPGNLQSAEQENSSLVRTSLSAGGGPVSVGHANLIFGSVEIVYANGFGTAAPGAFVTDLELHNHCLSVIDSGGMVPHAPEIDHAAGTIVPYGVGANIGTHHLRRLLDLQTDSSNYTVRYKYATGAGRWLRVMAPGEPYTPYMIGCTRNDPTVNDYDRLAWLMNWAVEDKRPILIDDWYHYKGTFELRDGIEIRQEKSWLDAGLKVCPWSTIPVIDQMSSAYDDTLPPGVLDKDTVTMIHGIGAKNITLNGLRIHGNVEANDDFLTDGNYNTTSPSVVESTVCQTLRESPTWCGLAVINHPAQRLIEDSLKVRLENVNIGDFGGSCLIGAQHTRHYVGRNVALGVSMSGRVKYGGSGDWESLWLYGYSRTAVDRSYTENVRGFRYTWDRPDGTAPTRLWPECSQPENIYGTQSEPQNTGLGHPRGVCIDGMDWDMSDVPTGDFFMGFNMRGQTKISGRIDTPANADGFLLMRCQGVANEGAMSVVADLDVFSRGTGGVSPMSSLNGGWHVGSDISIRIHETYDATTGNPSSPAPTLPTVPPWNPPQIAINVPSGLTPDAFVDQQDLRLHLYSEIPFGYVMRLETLPGLGVTVTPANFMPTTIHLSGRIENVTNKLFRGSNGSGPAAGLSAIPVRVLANGLVFRVYDPATSFVGDAPLLDNAFEILNLRGCSTPEGWRSEQDGTFDIVGSDLTGGTTDTWDVATNLLWRPKRIIVTPFSADAATYFRHVEVIETGTSNIITTGTLTSTQNAIQPTLRFHFDGATPAGADLKMGWSAAVSPY